MSQPYDDAITEFVEGNIDQLAWDFYDKKMEHADDLFYSDTDFKEYVHEAFQNACSGYEAKQECRYE